MQKKSNEITCIGKGNMNHDERKFVRTELEYCSKNNKMKLSQICDHLEEKGVRAVITKDIRNWAYSNPGNVYYSTWQSNKYGQFLIILLSYFPQSSNGVI